MDKINIEEKFTHVEGFWEPAIIAELNHQHIKIVRLKGEFMWHKHDNEDELFWMVKGELEIHLRDELITLHEGEMFIVPKGVEHKPVAKNEAKILMFEPVGTLNTGNIHNERTVDNPVKL